MGNKIQVKQEGGTGTIQSQTWYRYRNLNTPKKPRSKSNITELEDSVFTQGHTSYAVKYEDSIETLVNYVQLE